MKLLIFIFAVCFITVIEGRVCLSSLGNVTMPNATCTTGIDYCIKVDCVVSNNAFKFQGCVEGMKAPDGSGLPSNCTAPGTTTLSASGVTGQYYCCNDKDLCNDQSLNPNATNSASKPLVLGLILLSIVLALLF